MPKQFDIDGISPSTQIGKNGTRIASTGFVSQTRNAADSALARHQGAAAQAPSDFLTRAQQVINESGLTQSLSDTVQFLIINSAGAASGGGLAPTQDPTTRFLIPPDVEVEDFTFYARKAEPSDPDFDLELEFFLDRSGSLFENTTIGVAGDVMVSYTLQTQIPAGSLLAIGVFADLADLNGIHWAWTARGNLI